MIDRNEDTYGPKCICGHYQTSHHLGPILGLEGGGRAVYPKQNRINCRNCECKKFTEKPF